mgnify:CR=1 FL=1
MDLFNEDCFEMFPKILDNSVDFFLLDLPYANKKFGKCTACKWDTPIDLERMWIEIKRTMKPTAIIAFFCNTKFGFALIESNPKYFSHDLIWKKSRKVGFLSANKQQLRQHENIYIFKDKTGTYNPQKTTRDKDYKHSGERSSEEHYGNVIKCKKEYKKEDGMHPTSVIEIEPEHENIYIFKDKTGTYNPQKTEGKPYKDNVRKKPKNVGAYGNNMEAKPVINNGDRHPTSIIEIEPEHENIYIFKDKCGTYNPQKTAGKEYNKYRPTQNITTIDGAYGKIFKANHEQKVTDRHPTSVIEIEPELKDNTCYQVHKDIQYAKTRADPKGLEPRHPTSIIDIEDTPLENTILEYNNPYRTVHRTQKPVDLYEYLIKTYTNENDVVCDFTMGSGTAAIASINTNRQFVGCEMDYEIFNIAQERIDKHILDKK